jgi:hypothetical protein
MSDDENQEIDPKFFDRADAHINLSNDQLADINPGKVSASMMYATARFNAYISWIGFDDPSEWPTLAKRPCGISSSSFN